MEKMQDERPQAAVYTVAGGTLTHWHRACVTSGSYRATRCRGLRLQDGLQGYTGFTLRDGQPVACVSAVT